MRAAIYGAGAMGTVLGAHISRAGRQIDLITRNASHVEALKRDGAHIGGTVDFTVPVKALLPEEMSGKYDLIFLMTKQRENPSVCAFLSQYLSENGIICTMQNGLPEFSVASAIGWERTVGCAVSWGATFIGGGRANLTSSPEKLTFSVGTYYKSSANLSAVADILGCMGKVKSEENFLGARWSKLAVNSAFSSISALTGMTFGEVASDKRMRGVALELLNEAFRVGAACGVKLEKIQGHDIVKIYGYKGGFKRFWALRLLPLAMKSHKNIISGMYYDLKAGRKCDIDFINGVIIHAAKNFGVDVPLNRAMVKLVEEAESGKISPSPENAEKILAALN